MSVSADLRNYAQALYFCIQGASSVLKAIEDHQHLRLLDCGGDPDKMVFYKSRASRTIERSMDALLHLETKIREAAGIDPWVPPGPNP